MSFLFHENSDTTFFYHNYSRSYKYEIPRIFRPLPIIAWMRPSMLTGLCKYASLQNIHKKILKLRKLVALFTFEMGDL